MLRLRVHSDGRPILSHDVVPGAYAFIEGSEHAARHAFVVVDFQLITPNGRRPCDGDYETAVVITGTLMEAEIISSVRTGVRITPISRTCLGAGSVAQGGDNQVNHDCPVISQPWHGATLARDVPLDERCALSYYEYQFQDSLGRFHTNREIRRSPQYARVLLNQAWSCLLYTSDAADE